MKQDLINNTNWSVTGFSANDGISKPEEKKQSDGFSFVPKPINRPIGGSRHANTSIRYNLSVDVKGQVFHLSLEQDEVDTLRQEYLDFYNLGRVNWIPQRVQVVYAQYANTNYPWNTGNYNYIAIENGDIFQQAFDAINTAWVQYCQTNNIPSTGIEFNSAYRNPRKSIAVNGATNSKHTKGRGMDIVPSPAHTFGSGIWAQLKNVAIAAGYSDSHCDRSGTFVDGNCSTADHIHVQW